MISSKLTSGVEQLRTKITCVDGFLVDYGGKLKQRLPLDDARRASIYHDYLGDRQVLNMIMYILQVVTLYIKSIRKISKLTIRK